MVSAETVSLKADQRADLRQNAVPILFLFMCILGVIVSGQNIRYIAQELVSRLARNWFLIVPDHPVTAGLGTASP